MENYHDIRIQLGGDNTPPWFVIHRGETILALCIRYDMNPNITDNFPEVWVGADGDLPIWGERLFNHDGLLPLYVSLQKAGGYDYRGTFVRLRQHTPEELAEAQAQVPHPLSRIVFLKPL